MRLLRLIVTMLALLGAAYFTFYVPLGDGRTLGAHLGGIARSDEAKQLGSAVERTVVKAKDDIAAEVAGAHGSSSTDPQPARPPRSGKSVTPPPTDKPAQPSNRGTKLDRDGLKRLIAETAPKR